MVDGRVLDVYQAAYLAGGSDRVVDTAVVALVETGRVRVQSSGALCVVEAKPGHEVEAAVLDAIGSGGWRQIELVRRRAGRDERLTGLAERLRSDGLLRGNGLAGLRYRLPRPLLDGPMRAVGRWLAVSSPGRGALRELRTGSPPPGSEPGTSAARVALEGAARMADPVLRDALFRHSGRKRRSSGGRRWAEYGAAGAAGYAGYAGCGGAGHADAGCGGGGCGGCGGG